MPCDLSVIIPAYNEEAVIGKTLRYIEAYLSGKEFSWEILVVLDGVTDNTLGVIEDFAQGRREVRWIDRAENRGKGYTVREGMLAAEGKIRLFTDADDSTDISHYDRLIPLFEGGSDVAICSRNTRDAVGAEQNIKQNLLKRTLGVLGNLMIQALVLPGIWDTQCGFKAFRAEAAEQIFPACRIDGWGFDIEALALARRYGYPIGIAAAHWVNHPDSKVRASDYHKVLIEALRIRWGLMTGKYPGRRAVRPAS